LLPVQVSSETDYTIVSVRLKQKIPSLSCYRQRQRFFVFRNDSGIQTEYNRADG
jgi:hypothetical protein